MQCLIAPLKAKMTSSWAAVQRKHAQLRCGDTVGLKLRLLQTILVRTVHYGCEVWGMHSTHVAAANAARSELQRLYEFYLRRVCGLPRSVPGLCLLYELGLQPLKVYWWRQTLQFWNKLALASHDTFYKTVLLDNLQDAMRFKVPNFSRSFTAALRHLGIDVPARWDVLPALDVDDIIVALRRVRRCGCGAPGARTRTARFDYSLVAVRRSALQL